MSPSKPKTNITMIGLAFLNLRVQNAVRKKAMLRMKEGRLSEGEPKFSLFISRTAAEAISPMMVGRRSANMLFTSLLSLWVSRYRLMAIIMMNGSHMMESEAITEPITPAQTG